MRLLAGDIGGTNARLVLYEVDDIHQPLTGRSFNSACKVLYEQSYKNNDFSSFNEQLEDFVNRPETRGHPIQSCCLAVAGPVANNRIEFTNRKGWVLDGQAIAQKFQIKTVKLINDFEANGYGLLSLSDDDIKTLQSGSNSGRTMYNSPVALVGAGTGLGECFLTPNGSSVCVYPTEGGHVDFAPRTALEKRLLSFIQKRLATEEANQSGDSEVQPRVSVERVVSGIGLENIYEFLRESYPDEVNKTLDDEYETSKERGRLIGEKKNEYQLFDRSMKLLFGAYGCEVGNVALKFLAYGGVYIAGGIAPKNIELMRGEDSEFMARFHDKGRISSIMKDFAVHVVVEEKLGQRGAVIVASRLAMQESNIEE